MATLPHIPSAYPPVKYSQGVPNYGSIFRTQGLWDDRLVVVVGATAYTKRTSLTIRQMAEKQTIYVQSGLSRIVHAIIAPVFLYWAAGHRHYGYKLTVGSCCPWYQLFAVASIPAAFASPSFLHHGGKSAATVTTSVPYDGSQRLKKEGKDGTEMYDGVAAAADLALESSSQDLAAFEALQTGFRLYVRRG